MADTTGTRLFDLLSNDFRTDVTFNVQGVEVKAHGIVVMSGGGVLKERLLGNKDETIVIKEEVTPDTFQMLIKYIYTDMLDVNDENLFQVTHAAKIFGLDRLEKYCANVVKSKLAASNFMTYASHALELDAKENVKVCQEYFRSNTLQVVRTKEFLEISYDVLLALCSSDGITCSEVDLFLACVEWAKRECQRKRWEVTPENQRAALGDILTKIRFPVMKKEEFEDKVVPLEILTYEEVGRLIVGWKKKKQRTDFSDEFRTEVVQLSIPDHRKSVLPNKPDSKLTLPLSTSIKDLKEMKIFDNGKEQRPGDKFTLAHKGTILRNEETLASIYTPGEQLVIDVHSFDILVNAYNGKWEEFPLTVKHSKLPNLAKMILGAAYSQKGFAPDKAKFCHNGVGSNYNSHVYDDSLYPDSKFDILQNG